MAAEPSILGSKIKFWQDNTPSEYHTLYRLEDIDNFPDYEVEADGFAGLTLHRISMARQRILDAGYILPLTTSRGVRLAVARGSMEYSAVTQPLPLLRRNGGTESSTVAAHNTWVWPSFISTDPSAVNR